LEEKRIIEQKANFSSFCSSRASLCGASVPRAPAELTERPHHSAELLGCDVAVAVLVEQRERLFELGDLFLCELVNCVRSSSE
jgi:hypothetical protein